MLHWARTVAESILQLDFILAAAQEINYLEKNVGVSSESQAIKQEVTNLLKRTGFSEEKITGKVYQSIYGNPNAVPATDYNVWSPTAYPAGWQLIE